MKLIKSKNIVMVLQDFSAFSSIFFIQENDEKMILIKIFQSLLKKKIQILRILIMKIMKDYSTNLL